MKSKSIYKAQTQTIWARYRRSKHVRRQLAYSAKWQVVLSDDLSLLYTLMVDMDNVGKNWLE